MTDNLPAVRTEEPREVARADTDSWLNVVADVVKLAQYIAPTEFVPKSLRDNAPAAAAAILYGREVGLAPMTALTQTHVIEGRPSMAAEAMRALVLAGGHEIEFLESTGAICRIRARRRGAEAWTPEVIWTIDMARAAGLLNKSNWKNYPRRMLQARASSELLEMHFPDVVLGFRSIEEMEDFGGEEGDSIGGPQQSTTKVARKRAASRAALPAAPAAAPETPAGPPLPGESGFDDQAPAEAPADPGDGETSAGESDDGSSATHAEESGEDIEDTPADVVGDTVEQPADTTAGSEEGQPDAAESDPVTSRPDDPDPADTPSGSGRKASRAQLRMIMASLSERGVNNEDREERLLIASKVIGREIGSYDELTNRDANVFIDTLARTRTREELWELLDAIDAGTDQGDES